MLAQAHGWRAGAGLILGASLWGCSGDDLSAPLSDGSRLRVQYWTTADESRASYGEIFDQDLGALCDVGTAADGQQRCLPQGGLVLYLDEGCAKRAIVRPVCATTPHYGREQTEPEEGSCDVAKTHIFALGQPLPSDLPLFQKSAGACSAAPSVLGLDTWAAGPEIEPAALAEITVVEVPRGDDLAAVFLEGEDGFRTATIATDLFHHVSCFPSETADGARCLPTLGVDAQGDGPLARFSDAACEKPAGALFNAACAEPSAITSVRPKGASACYSEREFFYTGDQVTEVFGEQGGTCSAATIPSNTAYYRVGEPIPKADFPAVSKLQEGRGRLITERYVRDGAAVGHAVGFFDTVLGIRCSPKVFFDGQYRCVPDNAAEVLVGQGYFADPDCETPLVELPSAPCEALPEYALYESPGELCPGSLWASVHEIGEEHNGQTYALSPSGNCQMTGSSATLFDLGPETPLSTFERVFPPASD